jgi:FKBP-type peptidyl-prolyl cis-trans isomerase FklB
MMKGHKLLILGAGLALSGSLFAGNLQNTSYALGAWMAGHFKQRGMVIDATSFSKGFTTAYSGQKTLLAAGQIKKLVVAFQRQQLTRMKKRSQQKMVSNEQAGQEFLASNKTKPGIHTLPDGVQYKVLTPGTGAMPTATSTVSVNYEGSLLDGTVFDSSYKRNTPLTIAVNHVIRGWQSALTHMKTGATWMIYIPSSLAYGPRGTPDGSIGPNAMLIFKVELIKILS